MYLSISQNSNICTFLFPPLNATAPTGLIQQTLFKEGHSLRDRIQVFEIQSLIATLNYKYNIKPDSKLKSQIVWHILQILEQEWANTFAKWITNFSKATFMSVPRICFCFFFKSYKVKEINPSIICNPFILILQILEQFWPFLLNKIIQILLRRKRKESK